MNSGEWLLTLFTALLALPAFVVWLQVLAAHPHVAPRAEATVLRPRLAVLVPAHNEAGGITGTLEAVMPQLRDGDRLLVVADNCSDDTAPVARKAGAEVVQRHDLTHRGKGYALDFGVRHLSADPPPMLVMLDADCALHPGSLDALVACVLRCGRPAQAQYLMRAPPGAGLRMRVAEFAWRVKNLARPLGLKRLGGPCQLMGTGMAFPWPLICNAPLASGHLVEDMQLGIDLALAGYPPCFVPEALVTSRFPDTDQAARSQRTRWEHGHIATLLGTGPRLLVAGLRRFSGQALALAVDLMVPPLALLLMLTALLAMVNLVVGWVWLEWPTPALLSGVALLMLGSAVLLAWWRFGRDIVQAHELAFAPLYAAWKLPLYAAFLWRRQMQWIRAKRDDE